MISSTVSKLGDSLAAIDLGTHGRLRLAYELETPHGRVAAAALRVQGQRIEAEWPGARLTDDVQWAADGLLEVRRTWTIERPGKVRLLFAVLLDGSFSRWIVPAVMYDGNEEGEGRFPKGGLDVGWSFREDRVTIPSCSILFGEGQGWALFTTPAESERHLSSIRSARRGGEVTLEVATPYHESPHTYTEKGFPFGGLSRPSGEWLDASRGLSYERTFYVMPLAGSRLAFEPLFAAARRRCRPAGVDLHATTDWARFIALKTYFLRHFALYRRRGAVGIRRGVRVPPLVQRYFADYLGGGFLSKSLETAASFYRLGQEAGHAALLDDARDLAAFFLRGQLPSGLAFDDYSIHGRRFGGFFMPGRGLADVVCTRCIGESGQQYVRLYQAALRAKESVPEWLAHAQRLGDFFVTHQPKDGNFGRFWSKEGELLDARGTNGAYIIWLLADLFGVTRERRYLTAALSAAAYYIRTSVERQRFTFDTLDAECIDKEAGHVLLRAFLLLNQHAPSDALVQAAREAAAYCLTWQFAYDIPFDPHSPLGKLDFHSFGGTSVSVAHHHLDPYGLTIAVDFLRLHQVTGEQAWRQYAHDLAGYCSQLVSTPERPLDMGKDFWGYQPEQVDHTNWDYVHHWIASKGDYRSSAAWVPSSTLGACLDIREEFPRELPGCERIDLSLL
jgi:hypothetical protein